VEEVVIIAFLLLAAFAAAAIYRQRMSSKRLRSSFGPEYRRLRESGESSRSVRRELLGREDRVAKLHLVPLSPEQKAQLIGHWKSIQARFVDEPRVAVTDAENLLEDVMRARGYPEAGYETRLADLSVHHAHVLEDYREACEIASRHRGQQTSTEDLRRAMVLYRSLFEDLLER
jgi:hypothetical protein